jgi:hypothetical protein
VFAGEVSVDFQGVGLGLSHPLPCLRTPSPQAVALKT